MTVEFKNLPEAVSELLDKVGHIEQYLKEIGIKPNEKEEGLLTITEAGKLLSLSKNTIYKMVQKRMLPYSKRGKKLYFLKDELVAWVKGGKKKTEAELSAEAEYVFISKNKKIK